jgi:prepilin-type N-terminal cleavage/methylation domain-containing protein
MNREFTAKLLRHLSNKKNKNNKGFTLIELLVVVIIIGVLAAVALPNLLAQVGKARETEGKNAVGTITRAEQSYHFENQAFTPTIDNTALTTNNALGIIIAQGRYYNVIANGNFSASATSADATAASIPNTAGNPQGTRDYTGGIGFQNGAYQTVLCQGDAVGTAAVPVTIAAGVPTCPASFVALN